MTTFHVGCLGFLRGRARYLTRLRFVEIDLRPPLPSPKVFAGWKREVPEGFTFAAVAPATLYGDPTWPLKDAARTRSELDRMANHVKALGATTAVFRTPVALTPGSTGLKRLTALIDNARKVLPKGTRLVWEPTGVWEHDEAVEALGDPTITVACDPLHAAVTGEARVYARLRGLGVDARYDETRLATLRERVEGADEVFVVFQSTRAWAEAIAFGRLTGSAHGDDAEGDEEGDDDDEGDEGDEGGDDGDYDDEEPDEDEP